ncbi:MAG: CorA family divalent cation transporter [Patescibacteria group bacterium]
METIKGKVSWIDIVKPSEGDINWLKKTYHFHHLILDELRLPSARSKVDFHKDYFYFVYYFPVYDPVEKVSRRGEIDFIVTKKEVITVSYEEVEVFNGKRKSLKPESHILLDSLTLVHYLIETLLSFQQRQLIHIGQKVEEVSLELFKEREKQREQELLQKISYLKRDISQYRIIIKPQRHILESFFQGGCNFLGTQCQIYLNDLIGEHMKIVDQLEDYRQAVEDFESTNNQLIGLKNAQVVRTFTILAFVTFPMMLFSAIFSMNTKNTPIVESENGFWIILAIMVAAMFVMFAYFRKRDWL